VTPFFLNEVRKVIYFFESSLSITYSGAL